MKKFTAYILLICLFFTVLGYYFIFHVQISQAKSDMKAQLARQPQNKFLYQFSFNYSQSAELSWENDEEFEWKGQMYDVVEKHQAGGLLYVLCVADEHEQELIDAFVKANRRSSDPVSTSLLKLISAQFVFSLIQTPPQPQKGVATAFADYMFFLPVASPALPSPPPKDC